MPTSRPIHIDQQTTQTEGDCQVAIVYRDGEDGSRQT